MARRVAKKAASAAAARSPGFAESQAPYEAVMDAAQQSGLLREKTTRISGRSKTELIAQDKRRTGIESDTELIEFALASIALEDNFAEEFAAVRSKIDPDLKLGY